MEKSPRKGNEIENAINKGETQQFEYGSETLNDNRQIAPHTCLKCRKVCRSKQD